MDPNRPLRTLLPAPHGGQRASSASSTSTSSKRRRASAACEACRASKAKCTAERPKCRRCATSDIDCNYAPAESRVIRNLYAALKDRTSAYEEVYDLLMNMSEAEAQQILLRIRTGIRPEDIVGQVKDGNLLLQLSLAPEARRRYEFPYLNELPAFLLQSTSPYINTLVFEYNLREDIPRPKLESEASRYCEESQDVLSRLYHAAVLAEPRLDLIKPSQWTLVSSDDNHMRRLLGTYLLSEHFSLAFFQKDFFLEDMARGRKEYCSALLVNAILAGACHNDLTNPSRAEFWNPQNLGYRFLVEARRLYELGSRKPNLTTVQASLILHSVYNMHGADGIGYLYTKQAIEMSHQLGLFKSLPELSEKEQTARNFTAWSLYGWQGIVSYFAQLPPLLTTPPEQPLPDPVEHAEWYGEIWCKFPSTSTPFPTQFGQFHRVKTELYIIALHIASTVRPDEKTRVRLSVEQTMSYYAELMSWNERLPSEMKPNKVFTPHQLQLHILYQNLIINILEEPMATELSSPHHAALIPQTFNIPPHETLRDAKISFETFIRLYYLRHGFETLDTWMTQHLSFLALTSHGSINPDMQESHVKERHSTLVLAATGIRDQSRCHYTAQMVFSAVRGSLRAEEVRLVDTFTAHRGHKETHPPLDWESHSLWRLDFGRNVSEDRGDAGLSRLFGEARVGELGDDEQGAEG